MMKNALKYATYSPLFHWACILLTIALLPVAELPSGIVKSALVALLFTLVILAMLFSIGPEFVTRRDAAIANRYRARSQGMTYVSEPLSLDEAYLDVTINKQNTAVATEIATIIRARIKEVTGLNASAGISYCKFLAKLASDLNKPNGQAVITPKMGPDFVASLPC